MKFLRLVLILLMVAFVSGCSYDKTKNKTEGLRNNSESSTSFEKKVESLAFSWYREHHHEYENQNEKKYSFKIVDKTRIYGTECYLLIMYFGGEQYLDFAIDIELNKLYLCEDNFTFIPINNLEILDDAKFLKQAENTIEKVFNGKKNQINYCHVVKWKGKIYFMYEEYIELELQDVFLVSKDSKEVFKWNLSKDILEDETGRK